MKKRWKGIGIVLIIVVVCIPLALLITVVTSSFWLWFETVTGVESYGHSGPAEWCYLVSYGFLIICSMLVGWSFGHKSS